MSATAAAATCRQCSSGLQAIADVAAAIKAGFYTVGLAAGACVRGGERG
jgi:acetyl-CoA acetyltransferase